MYAMLLNPENKTFNFLSVCVLCMMLKDCYKLR